jgi:hypothetical protein
VPEKSQNLSWNGVGTAGTFPKSSMEFLPVSGHFGVSKSPKCWIVWNVGFKGGSRSLSNIGIYQLYFFMIRKKIY